MKSILELKSTRHEAATGQDFVAYAKDSFLGEVYVLDSNGEVQSVTSDDERRFEGRFELASPLAAADVLLFEHVPELQGLCLVVSAGHVLLLALPSEEPATPVGMLEERLHAAAWSPDGALLALVAVNGMVLLLGSDWDLHEQRALACPLDPTHPNVHLAWNADGSALAVGYNRQASAESASVVQLELLDRALLPLESSQQDDTADLASLQGLSWRPSGATLQVLARTHDRQASVVAAFEANLMRLRRADLSLPDAPSAAALRGWVGWNVDGRMLCVAQDFGSHAVLQAWTFRNYHWGLRMQWPAPVQLHRVQWDRDDGRELQSLSAKGLEVRWLNLEVVTLDEELGLVAGIDGASVQLTPFARVCVPPPLSAARLKLPCVPIAVAALAQVGMAVLSAHPAWMVQLFGPYEAGLPPFSRVPKLRATLPLSDWVRSHGHLRQMLWPWRDTLVFLQQASHSHGDHVLFFSVEAAEDPTGEQAPPSTSRFRSVPLPQPASRIFLSTSSNSSTTPLPLHSPSVYVELTSGEILRISKPTFSEEPAEEGRISKAEDEHDSYAVLPNASPWTAATELASGQTRSWSSLQIAAVESPQQGTTVVRLDTAMRLSVAGTAVSTDCTSFAVRGNTLLWTTARHELRHRALDRLQAGAPVVPSMLADRAVEVGAVLVSAPTASTTVVLEMPRGNLERLECRLFVLQALRADLDRGDYAHAFATIRRQRLDWNLLVDHSLPQFLQNLDAFVDALGTPATLCQFVASLRNVDVTQSLFSELYGEKSGVDAPIAHSMGGEGKVNRVCSALRSVLEPRGPAYTHALLATYVLEDPPDRAAALVHVCATVPPGTAQEQALRFLSQLVAAESLYRDALGLYDLALARQVARVSSTMDPRVYEPFLDEMAAIPHDAERGFALANHLGLAEVALNHLCDFAPPDRCAAYAASHKLYAAAYARFDEGGEARRALQRLHAEELEQNRAWNEAATLRMALDQPELAAPLFQKARNWRLALTAAELAHRRDPSFVLEPFARALSAALSTQGRLEEAARVVLEYGEDVEEAVRLLVEAHLWREARRVAVRPNRADLLVTHVEPAVLARAEELALSLTADEAALSSLAARLEELRERKRRWLALPLDEQWARIEEGEAPECLAYASRGAMAHSATPFSDSCSLASSSTAASSRSSRSSAASRAGSARKPVANAGKKRVADKPGSLHEEEWLVGALAGHIPSAELLAEVLQLSEALVLMDRWLLATRLQAACRTLVDRVRALNDLLDPANILPPLTPPGASPLRPRDPPSALPHAHFSFSLF